jgi:hypothetical protein
MQKQCLAQSVAAMFFTKELFQMRPHEAVNLSLSTLIFAYNNHYKTFLSPDVQFIYKSLELMETTIRSSGDFSILTHNSLLAAFQSHCIALHEAVLRFCDLTKRAKKKENDLSLYPVKQFISELRHGHAHLEELFLRPTWDKGPNSYKKPFRFAVDIPVSERPNGTCYDPNSKITRRLVFLGTPGREMKITQNFIHKIILLSFHFREIFKFRKTTTCDAYLNRYKSSWLYRS